MINYIINSKTEFIERKILIISFSNKYMYAINELMKYIL